jgi:zinc protease
MRVSPLLAVLWILSTSMVALVATAAEPTAPSATTPAAAPATAIPPGAPVRPRFDRKAFEIPHRKRVLGNGLTVLVHEDHAVPVVAVNLWYHVGSRNEEPGKTGFAHLFEHFFFNGSEHYPFGFREAMDDLGANNRNGTTSKDRTNFFEDVPSSALERTLYLEADRMGFLSAQINQAMLERERGVVQNDKRQGENQPYGRVYDRIVQRLYPANHPYSWPVIGSMQDLNAATLQDVQQWYGSYYGPNNCVLVLAGDITAEQGFALVEKYFGGIRPGPPLTRADSWVPRLNGNIREQMQERVPQTRIYRVFHAPAWRDPDMAALELLGSVLSGSRSARLDRRLIYQDKLATNVTAELDKNEIASFLMLTITLAEGADPARAEAQLDRVLAEFLQNGPTYSELERAKTRLLARFSREAEILGGFGGRSTILAESMTFDGRSEGYLTHLERMYAASASEVREAARRWLQAPHYTLLVTPFPALQPGTQQVDRKIVPALGELPDAAFPKVQHARLQNGLDVVLLERHSAPLINMTLAVDAGQAADPSERAGLARDHYS